MSTVIETQVDMPDFDFAMPSEKTSRDYLIETRDRISNPEHWTTGAMGHRFGRAFCVLGSLAKSTRMYEGLRRDHLAYPFEPGGAIVRDPMKRAAVIALFRAMYGPSDRYDPDNCVHANMIVQTIYSYNDSHSHAQVLAAMDRAILSVD